VTSKDKPFGTKPFDAKKFLSYYRPYRSLLAADLLCAVVVAGVTLSLPLCARHITKNILEAGAADALAQIYAVGALMLGLIGLYALCNAFVDYQGHMMGARMERDLRTELFAHFQRLSPGFFDDARVGQLMNRLTNDTFALGELYHHGPEDLVLTTLKFFGTFAILLSVNVPLTLALLLLLPVMAAYAFYFNRKMKAAMRRSRANIGDINAQAEDTLSGIRVVQSFGRERLEQEKFAAANERFLQSRGEEYRSEAWLYNGTVAFTQLFTAAIVVFGGASIARGALDLADLVTYLLYVGILVEPIRTALNFARLYQEGVTGFERVTEVLGTKPAIRDKAGAIDLTHPTGQLSLEGVRFRYQDGLPDVFRDLSLEVRAGEYVALVGPSGVGKTTLCSLIPRFYDVSAGAVRLDGVDVRDLSLRSLRQSVGVVQQDVYLFAGTVADNIRYGDPDASFAEVVRAAQAAHAHDFILALPQGYDTDVGQRGVKLSGGQKQRLSIARVFLKNPPVLIFDEATSALDTESERAVQASLERLARRRTTLVIAHRLSTVRRADRIVVLGAGGIVEEGTHDALIARRGRYARLHDTHLQL
jgi:ATP-binding cassette, subfamily B, bacterial